MAQPTTALSPEWDRRFGDIFSDLISTDEDLTRAEFDALIDFAWPDRSGTVIRSGDVRKSVPVGVDIRPAVD